MKTLQSLSELCPQSKIYIGRELTKMHEEMLVGTAESLFDKLTEESVKQKGEFVVIVEN